MSESRSPRETEGPERVETTKRADDCERAVQSERTDVEERAVEGRENQRVGNEPHYMSCAEVLERAEIGEETVLPERVGD